jgi:hypothetical protein
VLLQSADFAEVSASVHGTRISQITQIQERRQPGVARLTLDFTIATIPPVKMAWAIREIRVP